MKKFEKNFQRIPFIETVVFLLIGVVCAVLISLKPTPQEPVPEEFAEAVGKVLTRETNELVTGAVITVSRTATGEKAASTTTDAGGNFQLSGLPGGFYNWTVEKDGYYLSEYVGYALCGGNKSTFRFELSEQEALYRESAHIDEMALAEEVPLVVRSVEQERRKLPRPTESAFPESIDGATAILNSWFLDGRACEALDYAVGGEDFVRYAIVFREDGSANQANLFVSTTAGDYTLRFGGNESAFVYSIEDGVVFEEPDVIAMSCYENEEKMVWDFQITCVKISDIDVHFKVKSDLR